MPDYSRCVMYKINCRDPSITDLYIGSTCNFTRRKNEHKSVSSNDKSRNYNLKLYKCIRDNGGWDNFIMTPIAKFPCQDKISKLIEESRLIDKLKPSLNSCIPGRTRKQYYQDTHIKKIIIKKTTEELKILKNNSSNKYYKNNTSKIKKHKQSKILCDCGCMVSRNHISTHRKTSKHINLKNDNVILT